MPIGFEWDPIKARANARNHGISFEEACTVFDDPLSRTIDDPDHSIDEKRFTTIGHSDRQKLIVVCHCDAPTNIRIFSARPANPSEREAYESTE
jgi:uncharacterized DUF497 family protein